MTQQNTSRPGRVRLAARWDRTQAAPRHGRHPRRLGWLAAAAVIAAALTVAACGSSSPGGAASAPPGAASGAASSGALRTATIGGAAVLTNAHGFTLYLLCV